MCVHVCLCVFMCAYVYLCMCTLMCLLFRVSKMGNFIIVSFLISMSSHCNITKIVKLGPIWCFLLSAFANNDKSHTCSGHAQFGMLL